MLDLALHLLPQGYHESSHHFHFRCYPLPCRHRSYSKLQGLLKGSTLSMDQQQHVAAPQLCGHGHGRVPVLRQPACRHRCLPAAEQEVASRERSRQQHETSSTVTFQAWFSLECLRQQLGRTWRGDVDWHNCQGRRREARLTTYGLTSLRKALDDPRVPSGWVTFGISNGTLFDDHAEGLAVQSPLD